MTTTTATIAAPVTTRTPGWAGAFAGLIGAAVALGVSELIAGVLSPGSSLIAAVGQTIIDLQPPGAKDFVVALFGTNDKLALEILVTGTALAIGALLGYLGRDRFVIASGGFVAFGIVGFLAVLRLPLASATIGALSAGIGVIAGIQVMNWLMQTAHRTETADPRAGMPDWSRRNLLLTGSAIGGRRTGRWGRRPHVRGPFERRAAGGQRPDPARIRGRCRPAPGADLSPQVAGLTPIVMPNDRFYQIDTALLTPIVDSATWQLRIHGMVDRETTLTWDELLAMPLFEQYVTIACVSNEIGGNLVGNAKWTGVRLREVLDIAGVQAGATQLVGRSVDGWTAGMPTAWVMDPAREPMIAVRMNDEPLPPRHGFPARLIIPGLYGYVSATKWLAELELTTLEAFDGYWVPLGWAKEAPDPHAVADRHAARGFGGRRPRPDRGRGLGARPRHLEGRGRHRRAVAGGPPVVTDLGHDVGPMGLRLEQHAGQPPHRGACHRRHGRGPDGPAHAACAGRRSRLALRGRERRLSRTRKSV